MKISLQNKKMQGILSLIVASIMLMSYSNNPPTGKTGAPGEGLCTDCHSSGNPGGFDGGIQVTGFPSTITPNGIYPLTVTVSNPNGLAEKAGFQFTILNAANQKFGEFSAASPFCSISLGSRDYVAHSPAIDFPGGNVVTWSVTWTAPPSGASQLIKLFAAANIANGNDGSSGDWIVTNQFTGTYTPAPDPLTVSMSGSPAACFGMNSGTATATPAGGTPPYSYSWSNGQSTQTISNLVAGTYTVTVADVPGQTTIGTFVVTQPASETSVAILASTTMIDCNNLSATLTADASGGTSPYVYSWSNGANTSGISVFNGGSYSVTITDNNGCTDFDEIEIIEVQPPVVTITPVSPICELSGPVILSASPAGGFFGGPGVTGNQFNPQVAGAGTHTINYVYSENGCTFTESIQIIVNAQPVVTLDLPQTVCVNAGPVTLVASVPGGFWSGPGVSGNQFFPQTAGVGDHLITFSINTGCLSQTTGTISVIAAPTIQLPALDDLCTTDDAITLTGMPAGGTWSGTGVGNNEFDPQISGAGTFTLTYTYTNMQGCTAQATTQVFVNACGCDNPASANAGSDQDVCTYSPVQLNGAVNSTPLWSTSGDGTFTNPNNVITLYNWGPNDIVNKTVTLTLTAGDPDGVGPCTAFSDQMVVNSNAVDAVISAVPELCTTDTSYTLEAGIPGGIWSGEGVSGDQFDPAAAGIGIHLVFYSVTNEGCVGLDSIEVEVKDCDCLLEAHTEVTGENCLGDTVAAISVVIDAEGTAPYSYLWSDGSTGTSIDSLAPGTYTVTITDAEGCTLVIETDVIQTVLSFDIILTSSDCTDDLCIGNAIGGGPYLISWSNGSVTDCIEVEGSGADIYIATITNALGCTATNTFDYVPLEDITVEVDSISVNVENNEGVIEITIDGGLAPYTYEWEKGGVAYSTLEDLDSLGAGSYTLTITDAAGCSIESGPYVIETSSSNEVDRHINLSLYPSPADSYVILETSVQIVIPSQVSLFDTKGAHYFVKTESISANKFNINVTNLNPGVYIVFLKGEKHTIAKKLVILR